MSPSGPCDPSKGPRSWMNYATTTLRTQLAACVTLRPDWERAPGDESPVSLATGQGAGQHHEGLPRPPPGGQRKGPESSGPTLGRSILLRIGECGRAPR